MSDIQYGRNMNIEDDIFERMPEVLEPSYATVDDDSFDLLKRNYDFETPDSFLDYQTGLEGTVIHDEDNEKAAYGRIFDGDQTTEINLEIVGDAKGVKRHLEQKISAGDTTTQDIAIGRVEEGTVFNAGLGGQADEISPDEVRHDGMYLDGVDRV